MCGAKIRRRFVGQLALPSPHSSPLHHDFSFPVVNRDPLEATFKLYLRHIQSEIHRKEVLVCEWPWAIPINLPLSPSMQRKKLI